MLEIKTFLKGWEEVTRERAEEFYIVFKEGSTAIKQQDKQQYFNDNHIRGGHVLANGKVETEEEKKERIFGFYKNDLVKLSKGESVRFNCIEYVCNCPNINPFVMAAQLINEGIKILFDDSSISNKENQRKEKQVYKLV